ncbi:CapA family protein, partial [bacterium 210820-DFI.6.52]|nr:CapA family protein [bacterium 210820-DFI.6.52]
MLIFKIVVGSNKIKDINEQSKKVDEVTEVKKESITINFVGDITMGNYKGASYYGSFDN